MRIRSNLKAGQADQNPSVTAQAVVSEMVGSLQKDIDNLRIWSLIRVKGPGVSSWTVLNQKQPPQASSQA
ncbi:MAG: hypothetical protein ACWGO1_08860 [Anaerolineales bacterium]